MLGLRFHFSLWDPELNVGLSVSGSPSYYCLWVSPVTGVLISPVKSLPTILTL